MKIFVVALFFIACVSAGVLNSSRSTIVTLLDYYKNNKDEARIVGGEPASPKQFPWQAAVIVTFAEGRTLCGGSLIASRWVLTAAHCVVGAKKWTVKVGGINLNVANETGSVTISSTTAIPHEDYNEFLNNNIALIKLETDVEFTDTIQPIRLPSRSEVDNSLVFRKVTISGYGKTDDDASGVSETLNSAKLTVITNRLCLNFYGTSVVINSTICATGNPHHSPCSGDSGGPLIITGKDGQPTIVGVSSFISILGCDGRIPSGYVRTASFLDWISERTGIEIRD